MENIEKKYREIGKKVENIYDGRGRGVDIYVCQKCGKRRCTRYKGKGVKPYIIICDKCKGTMQHKYTIGELKPLKWKKKVENWVRPTLKETKKLTKGEKEHVLKGGLMLEKEIEERCSIKGQIQKMKEIVEWWLETRVKKRTK